MFFFFFVVSLFVLFYISLFFVSFVISIFSFFPFLGDGPTKGHLTQNNQPK